MLAYYRHVNNGKKIYLLDSRIGLDNEPDPITSSNQLRRWLSVWFEGRIENSLLTLPRQATLNLSRVQQGQARVNTTSQDSVLKLRHYRKRKLDQRP